MARVMLWAAALWLGLVSVALAENRVALVIGNGAYQSVNGLPNPANDAKLMAGTLSNLGFKVTLVMDGDILQMSEAVTAFGKALRDAGPESTGLFYYAGHGVQSFGRNYLLPVDARLSNAADLGLVAVDAETVLRQMFSAHNRTNIVILDACRNNPFVNVRDLGDNGLAEMSAPTGTFLAYATAPGQVALDGADGDSPFTRALAAKIGKPGLPIEQTFKEVRVAVLDATNGKQTPWDTSSLTNDFAFVPASDTGAGDEAALWTTINTSRDPVQIMLFLRAYPNSSHTADARALLAAAMQAEVAGTVPAVDPNANKVAAAAAPDEIAAFGASEAAGTLQGYQDFIAKYPNSTFVEAVNAEIAALAASASRAAAPPVPVPDPAAPAVEGPIDPVMAAQIEAETLAFNAPLKAGTADMVGKTIEELVKSSPLFPPFDGIPDEVWKGKHCGDCHKWTQAALCDQGKFYIKDTGFVAMDKQHPLGGAFRLTLKQWAQQGCN
ncbi:MAG: caspase family protein [Paracoccaceae bacterium]